MATKGIKQVQLRIRIDDVTNERINYWSDHHGISRNEYIEEAITQKIARENGDYDLPTMEQARLNQLIDTITSLSINVTNLDKAMTSRFDSLIGLTRGDNYLLDPEDGEI